MLRLYVVSPKDNLTWSGCANYSLTGFTLQRCQIDVWHLPNTRPVWYVPGSHMGQCNGAKSMVCASSSPLIVPWVPMTYTTLAACYTQSNIYQSSSIWGSLLAKCLYVVVDSCIVRLVVRSGRKRNENNYIMCPLEYFMTGKRAWTILGKTSILWNKLRNDNNAIKTKNF